MVGAAANGRVGETVNGGVGGMVNGGVEGMVNGGAGEMDPPGRRRPPDRTHRVRGGGN